MEVHRLQRHERPAFFVSVIEPLPRSVILARRRQSRLCAWAIGDEGFLLYRIIERVPTFACTAILQQRPPRMRSSPAAILDG
jgi:hypothetical protein